MCNFIIVMFWSEFAMGDFFVEGNPVTKFRREYYNQLHNCVLSIDSNFIPRGISNYQTFTVIVPD